MPIFRSCLVLILLAHCSSQDNAPVEEEIDGGLVTIPTCDNIDRGFAPPRVTFPSRGQIDVVPESLRINLESLTERSYLAIDVELWQMAGDTAVARVWSHRLNSSDSLSDIELGHGRFDIGIDKLGTLQTYGIRIRSEVEECTFSEWGAYSNFETDSGASYFFTSTTIPTVEFAISAESFQAIDDEARPPGCVPYERPYHSADMTFEGETFDGVGLRVKGGCGSARRLDDKAAFKSNLSWDDPNIEGCPENRRLHGLKRLTLNNQIQDDSNSHDRLAYHFYKLLDIPTPRVAPINMRVNDESWGLYLNVESISRRFIARWFQSNQGMLYEGTYRCDLDLDNIPAEDATELTCFSQKFSLDECDPVQMDDGIADQQNFEPLRTLIEDYNLVSDARFFQDMSTLFDMKRFINLMAADVIIAHWDGYMYNRNNYRLYHEPIDDLWTIIPTGVDQTLLPRARITNPFLPDHNIRGEVAARCLSQEFCRSQFASALENAIAIFENAELDLMAESIRTEIAELVDADPRKRNSLEQWNSSIDNTIAFIRGRPAEIRAMLSEAGF